MHPILNDLIRLGGIIILLYIMDRVLSEKRVN